MDPVICNINDCNCNFNFNYSNVYHNVLYNNYNVCSFNDYNKPVTTTKIFIDSSVQEYKIVKCVIAPNEKLDYSEFNDRPSIKARIEGMENNCLLDTGARINVIDLEIAQKLQIRINKKTISSVICANGSGMDIVGTCSIIVVWKNKRINQLFYVAKAVFPAIIFGITLIRAIGLELRWSRESTMKDRTYTDKTNGEICALNPYINTLEYTDKMRFLNAKEKLNLREGNKLYKCINKFKNIFMAGRWDIGKTTLVKHRIDTSGQPILQKPRRQPNHLERHIDDAISNLERHGIIEKCSSPWNTPMVCVWKKEKKEIRLCLDFRLLNQVTERPAFPMPNIDEMLDSLKGMKWFSSIDLGNAYYQVELEESSKVKTAFSTKAGQYCFTRMPFGIAAAPATFQKLMTDVLKEMLWKEAMVYLDDILIFSKTEAEHIDRLEKLFTRIEAAGLRINPEKCKFFQEELRFLGHIVNRDGIKTDPEKIKSIMEFEQPKCIKKLRSFLGLCNYYRKFIKNYSKLAKILEEMCGGSKDVMHWSEAHSAAFHKLKEALTSAPILCYPDFEKEFILDTDASFDTIGAVLSQKNEKGEEQVIAYGSKSMSKHEIGYCITRKELLAIFHFTQHFKHYLYGARFKLRTDHKAIEFMMTTKKPITPQFQNWMNFLSSLDMKLEYRKGELHQNADALSRKDCMVCSQCLIQHEQAKTGKLKTRLLAINEDTLSIPWQQDSKEIREIIKAIGEGKETRFKQHEGCIRTVNNKIWIPKEFRKDCILFFHKALCHAGVKKTYSFMEEEYDMEEFKKIAETIIRSCTACQTAKTYTGKTKEKTMNLIADRPLDDIYMDFCGPMPIINGKKYVLGIIDRFSRYVSLTAVNNQDETTTIETLQQKWIFRFGAPACIHVDHGKVFESRLFKDFAKSRLIKIAFSSPYHHSSNGIIERQFRTVRDALNATLKERKSKNWVELLPEIEFSMNASVQSTIGYSPAEVILGKRLTLDGSRHYELDNKKIIDEIKKIEMGKPVTTTTKRNFQIGDWVLVKIENRQKGSDRYEGPYEIISKEHDRCVKMRNKTGRIINRNIEWLKPFKEGGCKDK